MKEQPNPESAQSEAANPANNQTPTTVVAPAAAAPAANVFAAMSTAHKLMLAALAVHFVSLFLPYQDQDASGDVPILWNTGQIIHFQNQIPEQTGFQLKPFAVFVIIGLAVMFATKLYQTPFWLRYGYWISLVLLLVFAFGGAVLRTSGGELSLISIGLVILAAFLNRTASKQTPTP